MLLSSRWTINEHHDTQILNFIHDSWHNQTWSVEYDVKNVVVSATMLKIIALSFNEAFLIESGVDTTALQKAVRPCKTNPIFFDLFTEIHKQIPNICDNSHII